jgi:hypothetical protein
MKPYEALFPEGSKVRITGRAELERFRESWKFHNPLAVEQLTFAGQSSRVSKVAFYHGGDPLYVLEGVPGVWHESCLVSDS